MNNDTQLQLDFTVGELNVVLQALASLPYGQVAEFIASIQKRANDAIQAAQPAPEQSGP
jgi:hypothetical protein